MTRPNGDLRLIYPNKKLGNRTIDYFYPINKEIGEQIRIEVIKQFYNITNYGGHNSITI
jgi:hypothetical protein